MEVLAAAVDQQENEERQQGSGGSPAPGGGTAAAAKTRAAVQAEVQQEHAARIATEADGSLVAWTEDVHEQVAAADAIFLAARDAHQKADAARAAAREAYRSDQRSESKGAEWHARVADAQQAHEALRVAREALYRLQALAELLSKELQRRRSVAAASAGAATGGATSSRRRGSSEAGAAAAAAAAAGAAGAAAASASVQAIEDRLLVPPATQGTKRKRGAPPEPCPFCGHCYTVRDGLSSKLGASGGRLHLRRCQCRKKTPPCKNCPECKRLPDVMQLCQGASDSAAAFELCQRQYACAICACKCPGVGKWVENDEESRQAFRERTQKRHDEIVQMGWQGHAHTASAAPASTAGGGTVSAGTATAAHSDSSGGEGEGGEREVAGRARRAAAQQAPARSGPPRRLPADIRQELEAIQQRQQQGQSASCGMSLPLLPASRWQQGAAPPAADAHHHQQHHQQAAPSSSRRTGHSLLQTAGRGAGAQHAHGRHAHKHSHHHRHEHSGQHEHEHHHTCSHPHEDCTSDCCSAPTVAIPAAAGADPLLLVQQPGLAALAAALTSSGPGVPPPAAAGLGSGTSGDLMRLWEQMAASWPPGSLPAVPLPPPAAALPLLPSTAAGPALPPLPPLPVVPLARAPPELPAEVTALVHEVFAHAAGEEAAAAVLTFLRRQHLTSLCDFEFLERELLERELGSLGLPTLLLNKFLQLGRKRAVDAASTAAGAAAAGAAVAAAAAPAEPATAAAGCAVGSAGAVQH